MASTATRVCPEPGGCATCPNPAFCRQLRLDAGMTTLPEECGLERTRDNAPLLVRHRGGLALSLWLGGAGETDCIIAANLSIRCEAMEDALRLIAEHAHLDEDERGITEASRYYGIAEGVLG